MCLNKTSNETDFQTSINSKAKIEKGKKQDETICLCIRKKIIKKLKTIRKDQDQSINQSINQKNINLRWNHPLPAHHLPLPAFRRCSQRSSRRPLGSACASGLRPGVEIHIFDDQNPICSIDEQKCGQNLQVQNWRFWWFSWRCPKRNLKSSRKNTSCFCRSGLFLQGFLDVFFFRGLMALR